MTDKERVRRVRKALGRIRAQDREMRKLVFENYPRGSEQRESAKRSLALSLATIRYIETALREDKP